VSGGAAEAAGTRPVQAGGKDAIAQGSAPPVRPPGDLDTAPEPTAIPGEEPISAEEDFPVRANGNVSGPSDLVAAEGDIWHKSSWSRPKEPGGPVHCVEVTAFQPAAPSE
jgi:hypothetical protein